MKSRFLALAVLLIAVAMPSKAQFPPTDGDCKAACVFYEYGDTFKWGCLLDAGEADDYCIPTQDGIGCWMTDCNPSTGS